MKANNLTISIPSKGCDKKCPYCISRITGSYPSNLDLMKKKINKVRTVAHRAGVTSVLMTGKGEPTLNLPDLLDFCYEFEEFPIELQTNGIFLNKNGVGTLEGAIDVIAVSIDDISDFERYGLLFHDINKFNITLRISLNITDAITMSFNDIITLCQKNFVNQLSIKDITIPKDLSGKEKTKGAKQIKWIENNVTYDHFARLSTESGVLNYQMADSQRNICGISVMFIRECVQEMPIDNENIRSLIFLEDGHLYKSWNSKASRLF